MEYLILRRRPAGGLEGTRAPVGTGGGVEGVFQDLPTSEVRGLQRDDNVLGAARPMPLALIEPVRSVPFAGPAAAAADGGASPTWGVRAVKADTSPFSGKGVRVAVLDTGIDAGHRAFAGVAIVGRNFT